MPNEVAAPGTAIPADRLALTESALRGVSPSGGGVGATTGQWCSCVADEA